MVEKWILTIMFDTIVKKEEYDKSYLKNIIIYKFIGKSFIKNLNILYKE